MNTPTDFPKKTSLREFVFLAAVALVAAGAIATVSHFFSQYRARLVALEDQRRESEERKRKSAEAWEVATNERNLRYAYPDAKRMSVYTNEQMDVPSSLPAPVAVTLALDYPGHGHCSLIVDAAASLETEAAFFRPKSVNCDGKDLPTTGLVFDSKTRWPRGQLVTVSTAEGQIVPVIRLAKGAQMDAWLVFR